MHVLELANYMLTYLQKGDGIIMVVMLKFREILVVSKLFHPANLENDIFNWQKSWGC